MIFKNRREAGRELANSLLDFENDPRAVVLALPRGGVPVAFEVAQRLRLPLDIFLVRKLGTPGQPELAMGAVASGGARILNDEVIRMLAIPQSAVEREAAEQQAVLEIQERRLRGSRLRVPLHGKRLILVDDGLATGSSMRAALVALRTEEPQEMIVAVPVGARDTCDALSHVASRVVCLAVPEPLYAVGQWYDDFQQVSDEEVRELLQSAVRRDGVAA